MTSLGAATSFAGRRVLVVGLGRFGGGLGVTQWLVHEGARVTVTDQARAESLRESISALDGLSVQLHLGGHDVHDLDDTDLVVINPAVDKTRSEFFEQIVRRRIAWTTEMNVFCERCPAPVIGVTGTYGKSTTCAMLAEALSACRGMRGAGYRKVHLGGNIGRSLLMDLPSILADDLVVLEMSNSQLEDIPRIAWSPRVAVITNLWPHHLDRHGTFAAYVAAKLNLVTSPGRLQAMIVGDMHPEAESFVATMSSPRGELHAMPLTVIRVTVPGGSLDLLVPGKHNQANAACVLTVCKAMGLDETIARNALRSFRGLPHRLQHVRTLDGVDYVNDSKSTSPSATMTALESLTRPIVAIVGGQRKDVPLAECAAALHRSCRAVFCMGQSGPDFAEALRDLNVAEGGPSVEEVAGLEEAIRSAHVRARRGDNVLFSPGAPSFDAYGNFTQRGDHFVRLVHELTSSRS